jgi:hypothetical protein
MQELIELIQKTYGLVGLLIFLPAVFAVWVFKAYQKQVKDRQTDNKEWEDKLEKVQEQRVQDAQAITTKLVEIVSEQSGLNRETNMALERITEVMNTVTATMNQLLINLSRGNGDKTK